MSEANQNSKSSWIERSDDPDAAALTESWSGLSRLLRQSQPPLNQSALVAVVQARVALRERLRRRVRLGAVGLALAASLLVAVSLVWFRRDGAEVALVPQGGAATAGGEVASAAEVDPMLVWDDAALSESLASAQQEAHQLETNWRQPTDALVDFQYRLDALQAEIEDSSL